MAATIETLRRLAMQIRDEKRAGANTAIRVGNALLAIINGVGEGEFIRKDQPDSTDFLLQLLGGLEVGEAVDSMNGGKGTIIAPDGRIQTSRLQVRNALEVFELIFNRQIAQEGDFSFSESGTIDSVEKLDATTYRLTLRKRWENDFTGFDKHDICYGLVNDLSGTGEYFSSWFRVLNTNIPANAITVLLYPDAEVPGGRNYPPTEQMVITRRGNPVNVDRQAFWYISSYEHCICMLDGVTKPILEEGNYAVIIGRLKHLSLFDNLPINYLHSYIYCRGIAIQDLIRINYKGQIVRQERFRGEWSSDIAASDQPYLSTDEIIDVIYHACCKWQCLVSDTLQEPRWNSTDWAMIEGNGNLTMRFVSSKGDMFFAGRVSTEVTPAVYWGNTDISSDITSSDWAWTRNTGNVKEDNAWSVAHANTGRLLVIGNDDMGSNWGVNRKTEFICTAYVRDNAGEVINTIVNKVIA